MIIYEEMIASDIFDLIMGNDMHSTMDFSTIFDRAYIDHDNAKIYLLTSDYNASQFRVVIERV